MTAIEAPWRVKTRPCPFYQQGKCLFAESCNFLHNVQIKVPGGPTVIHASPPGEVDLRRTPEGPAVIVDSPHSYRSPPRSPRMHNLLNALKDVIGEDELAEDSDESDEERPAPPANDARPIPEPAQEAPDAPSDGTADAPHTDDDEHPGPATPAQANALALHQDREQSPEYEEADSSHSTNSAPTPDILSPVELSHLRLSGLDQLSHAKGNNSFDSGYAEHWQSPRPFALSPPRSPSVVSTFGLLASPFGSPSERVFGSPLAQRCSNIPASPLLAAAQPDADAANLEDDLDSPQDHRASVASDMTMEAATDVTEDLSFEAGEGSGVTEVWDALGQPTAMYGEPRSSQAEGEGEEEDVVDAYGESPAMHIGPESGGDGLYGGLEDADSSFGSLTSERISFSDADAQSTMHGPMPPRHSPPSSHEERADDSWAAQAEPATPTAHAEERDNVSDPERMASNDEDENLSDDTIDLHDYQDDTGPLPAADDTISSFGQSAHPDVDDTISSFGQAAEEAPTDEDATWSSFGHTGKLSEDAGVSSPEDTGISSPAEDTAELAYLSRSPSPTMRPGENDTLQNLYDQYSVASSPGTELGKLEDISEASHTGGELSGGDDAVEGDGPVEESPALTHRAAGPSPSPPGGFTIDDYAVQPPSPATELDELMADVALTNQATPPTPRDARAAGMSSCGGCPSPHASLRSVEYVSDALTPESLHSREVEEPPYDDYYDLMSPEASDPPPTLPDDDQSTPSLEDAQFSPPVELVQPAPVVENIHSAPMVEDA
ncbi:hypothetical protein HDZ31DRAFT_6529, partial [Schizophyllum fasciatum]